MEHTTIAVDLGAALEGQRFQLRKRNRRLQMDCFKCHSVGSRLLLS